MCMHLSMRSIEQPYTTIRWMQSYIFNSTYNTAHLGSNPNLQQPTYNNNNNNVPMYKQEHTSYHTTTGLARLDKHLVEVYLVELPC